MEVIGYLKSCYPDKFGIPRQPGLVKSSWASLQIDAKFQPKEALMGLEAFSHVWLIFLFHQNSNSRYHAKVHPPRLEGESIGVFASRSPHRPNPIGLSLVELEKIEDNTLTFRGADLLDGTPILDLKPYLPEVESKPEAKGGWTQALIKKDIEIEFTEEQLQQIHLWSNKISQPHLLELIEETLKLDPRPLVYKGFDGGNQSKYRQEHAIRFFNGDIHFRFINPKKIQILKVLTEIV